MSSRLVACLPAALAAVSVLACHPPGASRSAGGGWVVVRVDAVEASQTRPGTASSWDGPAPQAQDGADCALLGLVSSLVLSPVAGKGLQYLCQHDSRPQQVEKDPTAPDLFVRLQARDATYDTYTAWNSAAHVFGVEFVLPVDAVPPEGITLSVLDRDGAESDLVGHVRVVRQTLVEFAAGRGPLLSFTGSAGLRRLDLVISRLAPQLEEGAVAMDPSHGTIPAPTRRVRAGEVVEIVATGAYRVGTFNSDLIDPRGYPGGALRQYNFANEPFRSAPHGSGLALIGPAGSRQGLIVAPCVAAVARVAGPIVLGVNDSDPENNRGELVFAVRIRPPTPIEWLGSGSLQCPGR